MVRNAKLVIIVDNEAKDDFLSDWGLSMYVETNEWVMLFDADTNPYVLEYNADKLGIDLSRIEFAFLSHHHGDHYGGFKYVGNLKPGLKVYVPPGDVEYLRSWGLNPLVINAPIQLAPSAWSTGPLRQWIWGVQEHAFAFHIDGRGLTVLVGCSHPGVSKLVKRAIEVTGIKDVYLVIGGYHEPSTSELDELAKLSQYVAPLHCSGYRAKNYVRTKYPEKYVNVRGGDVLSIS